MAFLCLLVAPPLKAQTLNTTDFQIEWKVVNRFRLFNDASFFRLHENAWRQYLIHVNEQQIPDELKSLLINSASVLGSEHVLNDRYIAFSRIERSKFDWRGWAAQGQGRLCWNPKSRLHDLCGDVDGYVNPKAHEIEISLRPLRKNPLISEYNCEWRVGDAPVQIAPCDGTVTASLPYPGGADISVAVAGEQPIALKAKVRDLLIVGMGDSFASGEGNPDMQVRFSSDGTSDYASPGSSADISGYPDRVGDWRPSAATTRDAASVCPSLSSAVITPVSTLRPAASAGAIQVIFGSPPSVPYKAS